MRAFLVIGLAAALTLVSNGVASAQSGRLVGTVQRQPAPPSGAILGDVLTSRRGPPLRVTTTGIVVGSGFGVSVGGAPFHTSRSTLMMAGAHYAPYAYYPVTRTHVVFVDGTVGPQQRSYGPQGDWLPSGEWRPFTPRTRPADQSCALVAILESTNRGYWQELALPAGGARSHDELQRFLDALLAEGLPFRVRDAAGETLDVPAAAQIQRIVVHPCT